MSNYYDATAAAAVARADALADIALHNPNSNAVTHCVAAVGYAATMLTYGSASSAARFRPVLRAILARIGRA